MNSASTSLVHELRPKILEKRARLKAAARSVSAEYVTTLLAEVDDALKRIDDGVFGICESCHEAIEVDRLEQNPLIRFCLDHLNEAQRRAHEQDLELATKIQSRLLPARDFATPTWRTHYRYEPAGVVGGDYCEVAASHDGKSLFFALGDVAGKGIAASLLMAHLSAIFRSLLSLDLPLADLMVRANRLFCESTPSTHYATLVAGRAGESGIELCNAGHCRPFLLRPGATDRIDSTGLPLGLFCEARYETRHIDLRGGESLALYSDGIIEAQDPEGGVYDEDRFIASLRRCREEDATVMADHAFRDVAHFRSGGAQQDDMTLLIIRRQMQ